MFNKMSLLTVVVAVIVIEPGCGWGRLAALERAELQRHIRRKRLEYGLA